VSAHTYSEVTLFDGAVIRYLTAGPSDGPVLVLVHGSTETGESDWFVNSDIATRFGALGYRVIVPDCRGHGQSSATRGADGTLDYSFEQMAADIASLLQSRRTKRALVCGHSNGGTVALCLARSFPRVIRAAAVLAGNAYVDDHVRSRVPVGMDPDRVDRESTGWRDSMIALHDTWHGPNYWRDLLKATIRETVAYPNWTAADLAELHVPVLAIQGSDDSVNVPGRHAETIADWCPNGQLWIADGCGHSVHYEQPTEFVRRVHEFFEDAPA
jgi:pimeloyl-ACP methyl ester carboxylesterase